MERTVVALFDDVSTAQRALEDLLNSGFDRNDVSVMRANRDAGDVSGTTADTDMGASGAAAGAGIARPLVASPAW